MRKKWFLFLIVLTALTAAAALPKGTLEQLPFWAEQEIANTVLLGGGVHLTLRGAPLPLDPTTNTYYLPLSAQAALNNRALRLESEPGVQYGLLETTSGNLVLCARSAEGVRQSTLVFTDLPVIALNTPEAAEPSDEPVQGELVILTGDGRRLTRQSTPMTIHLRGQTSRRYPKQSYRVQLMNAQGENQDLSLAGLRSDDDWILNPMYTDTSKIREPLAAWLWEQMDSSAGEAAGSRIRYAEILLNGRYWGLYGVQERIDRKQVNANRHNGILYKIQANDPPTTEQLLACTDPAVCAGFELVHAGTGVTAQAWLPAASYMAVLNGEPNPASGTLDVSNVIDYGLWVMATQAYDCHFKNQFLHCVYNGNGHTIYKIPWDMNHTFGDAWNGESEATNYLDYVLDSEPVLDDVFAVLLANADARTLAAVRERWEQLRRTFITEENILKQADALFVQIQGALKRDSERWPECGIGDGNDSTIRDIEVFVRTILPQIDAFASTL